MIRLLFIGDVVGRSGRAIVLEQVPVLRARWGLDFVVLNGENAAGGFGLTENLRGITPPWTVIGWTRRNRSWF